ncbi:HAD family hydrolase [soil metagenome]
MKDIAVIFDMDGVIVDNTSYHIKAWESFCGKHKINWDREIYLKNINGRTLREGIGSLFSVNLSPEDLQSLCLEKEEIYREIYKKHIVPAKGLLPLLEHLSANDIPKAIATSANALNVKFTLEHTGIGRYFDIILDENSITKGKPDPQIFLNTAKAMGVPPETCVVFEDSLAGIQAAANAGMKIVGIATTHPREVLTDVNLVKDNFEGITIKTLKSLFI